MQKEEKDLWPILGHKSKSYVWCVPNINELLATTIEVEKVLGEIK
jgi:hypothetical protein